jgi:hypothetical protein
MDHNYSAPPPPRNIEGYPPPLQDPGQQYPNQQYPGAPQPHEPRPPQDRKALFIVLGLVAAAVIAALVAVFAWVVPAFTKPQAADTAASAATMAAPAESAAGNEPAEPQATAATDVPAGAFPLPPGWEDLQGPANVPADGDPLFSRFVTGESSFQYLKSWTLDETFGITTDPTTGVTMQQKAQGTEERDGDGIALAYAFFAEAEEGKYGKEPGKVKAAIQEIQSKFTAMPPAELPQHLVGHKCTSNFQATTPEIREFRRAAAVVIGFTCTNSRGENIEAVNLFSVTPWGTPQMMGASGHESYWNDHPELMEQLANSYRANRWKLGG